MLNLIKNIFKKKTKNEPNTISTLTITVNNETFTTTDEKEISELIKLFGSVLQSKTPSNEENFSN